MSDTTKTDTVSSNAATSDSKPRFSMAQQVLVALLIGVAAGLFFGEWTTRIKFVGDIYVGLLQMMVLPYIIISLIGGIGKLTLEQAKQLAKYAVVVLLLMWAIIGFILVLLPFALPDLTSASFYSSSLVEPAKDVKFINIFIPKNIFASLSNNQIPGVVVFCIALGIALITADEKQNVFNLLDVLAGAVMRVIKFVVKLTPLGVFAMTAAAAGTMEFEELGRLQGYFILYTVAILILGFWVLPGLIASLTPFKYRDVITIAWSAMALSFAAAKVLVALPLIIESIKELFDKYEVKDPNAVRMAEMLVPISYPFPNTGKLLSLFFIPFSAWFIGSKLGLGDYPAYLFSGLLSYFGNVAVAVPFLLDLMRLPADMFQIFLLTGVYCGRMSDALGAMDMFTFAALVACASSGMMRIQWKRVILILAGAVVVILVAIIGVRTYLGFVSQGAYDKDKVLSSMQLMEDTVSAVVVKPEPNTLPLKPGQSRLERVKARGIIRVGYDPERLPFSYTNVAGKLVGFDLDMAQRLAQELGVTIELVPFTFDSLAQQLRNDHFDIAMSGVYGTVEQSGDIRLSDPYMFATMALVAPDHRDMDFATLKAIKGLEKVRIGIHRSLAGEAFVQSAMSDYPNVKFVTLDTYRDFFEQTGPGEGLDALFTGAESGSAWTLLYPSFQVVTPWSDNFKIPIVYPYSGDDDNQMDEFMDHWVLLKQHDGTTKRAFEHWILGKGGEKQEPRWSVIRNVFGWVD
jgi:Na+/H+-dicarboxylate symporter